MRRFAANTTVPVEQSKAEIEGAVSRYGATAYQSGWKPGAAMIAFRIEDMDIQFQLPIPDPTADEFKFRWVKVGGTKRRKALTENQSAEAHRQEVRRRWRALALVVKAKLEAVETHISTIEREFMAFVVVPGTDRTLGDWLMDRVLPEIKAGHTPLALAAHEPPTPRIVQLDTGS